MHFYHMGNEALFMAYAGNVVVDVTYHVNNFGSLS